MLASKYANRSGIFRRRERTRNIAGRLRLSQRDSFPGKFEQGSRERLNLTAAIFGQRESAVLGREVRLGGLELHDDDALDAEHQDFEQAFARTRRPANHRFRANRVEVVLGRAIRSADRAGRSARFLFLLI